MSLVRTSLWNGLAVAVRMGAALVLNKILAIYTGPSGYALIGQFQNAVTMAVTFGTGAIGTGVTKHSAEYRDDAERRRRLWRTATAVVLGGSIVAGIGLTAFSAPLARLFLRDPAFAPVFVWLAAALALISLNALLLAILNGLKEVRRFVVSNIAGSLLGLALTGYMASRYGLYGALIALSLNQAVAIAVTVQQAWRLPWFRAANFIGPVDRVELRRLGGFVLMAATTAITGPVSQLLVRGDLGRQFGWDFAGYWDAAWRISTLYLTLVTTTLTLYYLPRIAEITHWAELRDEMARVYRVVMPLVIASALAIYLARDLIVTLLFTPDFAPMRRLFAWQMAGDVVKIGSWLLAYLMIGRGLTRAFIATEIMAAALFVIASFALTRAVGFEGVALAHLLNYSVYAVVVWWLTVSSEPRRRALFRETAA